jgi:cell wall-associated NlpC family hydrolase
LKKLAVSDLSDAIYEKGARLEEAPFKADCLTSIYYLFSKALNIQMPVTFIGDMPRSLVSHGWKFCVIDSREVKAGDFLFFKRRDMKRLITHMALALNSSEVVHFRRDMGKMVIEPLMSALNVYEQEILEQQLLYIDFRNEDLRKTHGGCYLTS